MLIDPSLEYLGSSSIAFIGGGHMACCLVGGLLRQGMPAESIRVAEPHDAQRVALEQRFGVRAFASNCEAAHGAKTWVLAVKPQIVQQVCRELAPLKQPDTLVVSIAAGVRVEAIARWLSNDQGIVRCMPNLPALVGAGMSGLFAAPGTTPSQRERATGMLSGVGQTVWVEDEAHLDAVTAVSGSGPAYLFLMAEALHQAARELGLPDDVSGLLVRQTLMGSVQMMADGTISPAELRRRVTSPGGTTEAALSVLQSGGFPALLGSAVASAAARSRVLSEQWLESDNAAR